VGDHAKDRGAGRLSEPGGAPARETIAAIATASGRAGIGVVRVSGPQASTVARAVLGRVPRPRHASLCAFRDPCGRLVDRGIALLFRAPASYTGEDVLELHAHGSQPVLEMLLECALAAGARLARTGEFTERAFLEGRLDLAQAEAVADLIEAGSREAARAAQASLAGEFSRRVHDLVARLTALRVRLEAALDFAEEDDRPDDDARALATSLGALGDALAATTQAARGGVRLRDGLQVVLVGAPNVGKSSIMNRLAGVDRAIVTAHPGTTRDVLRESVRIGAAQIELLDTAGLRDSDDEVEQAGMRRTREQAQAADLVLLVSDPRQPAPAQAAIAGVQAVTVHNKVDLSGEAAGVRGGEAWVSALTGAGFDALLALIEARAAAQQQAGPFTARARHVEALEEAGRGIDTARALLAAGGGAELVAEELRRAQGALGTITGEVGSDDLLGEIFATFCIGK